LLMRLRWGVDANLLATYRAESANASYKREGTQAIGGVSTYLRYLHPHNADLARKIKSKLEFAVS